MAEIVLDYQSTYKKPPRPFRPREYLLLAGGPTNSSDRVLKAISHQCLTPLSTDLYQLMDDIKEMGKYVLQTKSEFTFAIQTSGNGGNEAVLRNLTDPGETIIIAIAGVWGERVADMADRYKLNYVTLRKPPGEIYSDEELEEAIIKHKPAVLFVTHGDSTGGTIQPLENLGKICHKHDCLLAIDAVVSAGVVPLFTDRWQIDAVVTGSQKGLRAPAGLALITLSPQAVERMLAKKERPPYYLDLASLARVWDCFGQGRTYHYTYSSNLLCALRESLAEICEEGLLNVWSRHKTTAELFWQRLDSVGLELFVEKPENRFYGVNCVKFPTGIDCYEFLNYIKNTYSIDISPGAGPTSDQAMRVGFMGSNSKPEVVEYLIEVLKDTLQYFQTKKQQEKKL